MKYPVLLVVVSFYFSVSSQVLLSDTTVSDSVVLQANWKVGETTIYRQIVKQYAQNELGGFKDIFFDTSYVSFSTMTEDDSLFFVRMRHVKSYTHESPVYYEKGKDAALLVESYNLIFDKKGKFLELNNWQALGQILIQNLVYEYQSNKIDSNTLKAYYAYYLNPLNVENTVLQNELQFINKFGETIQLNRLYDVTFETVNPFSGARFPVNGKMKAVIPKGYKNSVFITSEFASTSEDNSRLQADFLQALKVQNQMEPIEKPYIYIVDSHTLQYNKPQKRLVNIVFAHTIYVGSDKQGIDRMYNIVAVYDELKKP